MGVSENQASLHLLLPDFTFRSVGKEPKGKKMSNFGKRLENPAHLTRHTTKNTQGPSNCEEPNLHLFKIIRNENSLPAGYPG